MNLTKNEFLKLSKKGNLIPVYKEINADLDTPVSAFLKIKKDRYAFLLESVEGQEKIAKYSFLGSNPALIFKSKGRNIEIIEPKKKKNYVSRFIAKSDPLDEIKDIMRNFNPVEVKGLPRFCGGLVGYISYDMVRFFEKIPDTNPQNPNFFDAVFILTDTILVFDHVNHTIKIVSNVIIPKEKKYRHRKEKIKIYNSALTRIREIEEELNADLAEVRMQHNDKEKKVKVKVASNFTKNEFKEKVNQIKKHIKEGDIIQAVLSQRFSLKSKKKPFDIYRSLRNINPSPYMYYLSLGDMFVIGSSPEMLVRCEDGLVETRPIAGTRPRGANEKEDRLREKELLSSAKEKAEHIMLVDLGRNDLGRVCGYNKVEVKDFMSIERYSHVMHLVTQVSGILDKRYDIYDVLRACFPAGTVTGSPKVRAMEIIEELENLRRGPYAGCVGYFSFSHNMDTCITIRTIIMKDSTAYVQAGAGIVADSVPEKEYLESQNKAKALIEAITN